MRADNVRLLASTDLFGPLSPEEAESMMPQIPVKAFERGQHVYTPDYRGRVFFVLLKGLVRIYKVVGANEVTILVVRAGRIFGEAAFTDRKVPGSYAEALVPSRVALVNRAFFERLVSRSPRVGLKALELLSERVSVHEHKIAEVALKEVPSRLAGLILDLARSEGVVTPEGCRILTRYTQEQLGAMIGAKRVAVTRALTGLREAGIVEIQRRRIYVKDMEALKRAAA